MTRPGQSNGLQSAAGTAALLLVACSGEPVGPDLDVLQSRVVYGEDDRREYFEVSSPDLRAIAEEVLVIVPSEAVQFGGDEVQLVAPTLGKRAHLCEGEPFFEQPAAGFCTAALAAPDLVLTAGHCLFGANCDEMFLVRGYLYEEEGVLRALQASDVYACAEVVAERVPMPGEGGVDYAWLRLDRAVTGAVPLALKSEPPRLAEGDPVIAIGASEGLPVKVDQGGRVGRPHATEAATFTVTTDTFIGGSGSPLFDRDLNWIGVLDRGATDYAQTAADCNARTVLPDSVDAAVEEVTYVSKAYGALCEAAPNESLCCVDRDCAAPTNSAAAGCTTPRATPIDFDRTGGAGVVALLLTARWRRKRRSLVFAADAKRRVPSSAAPAGGAASVRCSA